MSVDGLNAAWAAAERRVPTWQAITLRLPSTADSSWTGRRLRGWLRFVHTGEAFGLAGQTLAGLASAGGTVLVYTGLALSLRRFRAWRRRTA